MIGWSLQWIGRKQIESRVKEPQREKVVNDGTADKCVEVKVIAAVMEEVLKAE
jgi:ASC-1-like (ASCH) protein